MAAPTDPHFLYLTTIGRKSGRAHTIEIWFVEHGGNYYLVSEHSEKADWVQNIAHNAGVIIQIGSRDADSIPSNARKVDRAAEPELSSKIAALMDAKYNWSDGQIVELKPTAA